VPHYRADSTADSTTTASKMEDKGKWHHRLLKSASGVLQRQESPEPRQCVDHNFFSDAAAVPTTTTTAAENEAEEGDGSAAAGCEAGTEDKTDSSSASLQPNINTLSLPSRVLMALSLMIILHAMMANL
jgi:hypothetical protein